MATKLDTAGLVRVERQRELLKPHTHCIEEATGVVLMLETGHQIIGIAHDNHVAGSLVPSPALGPQVEDVVQVDVGKQWRRHSLNAKGNFRFERTIVDWRSGFVLD